MLNQYSNNHAQIYTNHILTLEKIPKMLKMITLFKQRAEVRQTPVCNPGMIRSVEQAIADRLAA
jgi:hypothetical protein